MEMDDIHRLRKEYADRDRRFKGSDVYSYFNPSYLFMIQQRQRAVLKLLRQENIEPIHDKQILEIGCGGGRVLLDFLLFGADQKNLYGVDLLFDRLEEAGNNLPASNLVCCDGQKTPYASGSFDIVCQFTALSSILDPGVRFNMAAEMLRLVKANGIIISYDFWINPNNSQTIGISPKEIKRIFPGCQYIFRRITLAPPISRVLTRISRSLVTLLESFTFFNTHYLTLIFPPK
jgi:SAM-dependent methyltransferase